MLEDENFINVNELDKDNQNHMSIADKSMKMRMIYQRN